MGHQDLTGLASLKVLVIGNFPERLGIRPQSCLGSEGVKRAFHVSFTGDYPPHYSRALTGSQSGGDAYVFATLEAIVTDPNSFAAAGDLRTALYRLFLKVWGSMPINDYVDQATVSGEEIGARRNLDAITLRPRIAFLLSALEEFETAAVADTLECSIEEAAFLIDAAGREIAKQIRTDVLIIEDEPLIALDLQNLVEELGHRAVSVALNASRSYRNRPARASRSHPHRCSARGRQFWF